MKRFGYVFTMEKPEQKSWAEAVRAAWRGRIVLLVPSILFFGIAQAQPHREVQADLSGWASATLSSPTLQDGHLGVVRVESTRNLSRAVIRYLGEELPLFRRGTQWVGWLAVPHNSAPGAQKVEVEVWEGQGSRKGELKFEITSGQYREETLPVDPRFVKISPQNASRIEREIKEVKAIYQSGAAEPIGSGVFSKPVDSVVSSPFGTKRMFNGEVKSFHSGADLRAQTGTPILAAADGVVVLRKDLFFTGNTVILDHGGGIFTIYAHLSRLQAKLGRRVARGEQIGRAGSTGRSSGPHLHWGAVAHRSKFDPLDLLQYFGEGASL